MSERLIDGHVVMSESTGRFDTVFESPIRLDTPATISPISMTRAAPSWRRSVHSDVNSSYGIAVCRSVAGRVPNDPLLCDTPAYVTMPFSGLSECSRLPSPNAGLQVAGYNFLCLQPSVDALNPGFVRTAALLDCETDLHLPRRSETR